MMAYEALRHYSDRSMRFHFVSNIDGTDFAETVRDCDPEQTLFVICSKTFTTLETLSNANQARRWALDALGDESAVAVILDNSVTAMTGHQDHPGVDWAVTEKRSARRVDIEAVVRACGVEKVFDQQFCQTWVDIYLSFRGHPDGC